MSKPEPVAWRCEFRIDERTICGVTYPSGYCDKHRTLGPFIPLIPGVRKGEK